TQTVNPVSLGNTTTSVTSSVNPSVFGQAVTFTATVTPTSGVGTPSGAVTFLDGGASIGSGTLSGDSATFSTSVLGVGSHTIRASYSGDGIFNGSTSSAITQTVTQASTTVTLTSASNRSGFGDTVPFTATVTAVLPGTGTPTGTVIFLDNGVSIGTGTLSGGIAT